MKRPADSSLPGGGSIGQKVRRVDNDSPTPSKKVGLHVFTRDFRFEDNACLERLAARVDQIRLAFVFTPEQTKDNQYFGARCFAFLLASLKDLERRMSEELGREARLEIYYGAHAEVLENLFQQDRRICVLSMAEDFTPYARAREARVAEVCRSHGKDFILGNEHSMTTDLLAVRSGTGSMYRVFSPFWRNVSSRKVQAPVNSRSSERLRRFFSRDSEGASAKDGLLDNSTGSNQYDYSIDQAIRDFLPGEQAQFVSQFLDADAVAKDDHLPVVTDPPVRATRAWALDRLRTYQFNGYATDRDNCQGNCSLLSPHFKFGLVSLREVYEIMTTERRANVKDDIVQKFVQELYWRDFYQYVCHHFPHVLEGMKNVTEKSGGYENQNFTSDYSVKDISWASGKIADENFQRWSEGKTGVPLVDAGMREMKCTGFMHNRARMVVAMFLTKNLLVDWRRGEKFFAQNLVDYDPLSNNGGWQWSSSTGADGNPYFRIMNPQSQLAKADPSGKYVQRWIPELSSVAKKDLDKWEEKKIRDKYVNGKPALFKNTVACAPTATTYPAPMVDLKASRQKAIDTFKAALAKARAGK